MSKLTSNDLPSIVKDESGTEYIVHKPVVSSDDLWVRLIPKEQYDNRDQCFDS